MDVEYLKKLKEKTIVIMGFGKRTGISVANFCYENGISYLLVDDQPYEKLKDNLNLLHEDVEDSRLYFKGNLPEIEKDFLIVLSPGVPRTHLFVKKAIENNIDVIGDIELFYNLFPQLTYIAITGTDGKTTTTSLVGDILERKYDVFMAGNIGYPIFDIVHNVKHNSIIVLELSSFQLESIINFHPKISAILNLSYDHLNRYNNDINLYFFAKQRIYKNQTMSDYLILNMDNKYTAGLSVSNVYTIYFSRKDKSANFYHADGYVFNEKEKLVSIKEAKIKGIHNIENILASVAIAKLLNVNNDTIEKAINNFQGLPHRNEYITSLNGVDIYNDSKATTINAVEKAILSHKHNLHLIMGGKDKNLPFYELRELIYSRVKKLYLIGVDKEKLDLQIKYSNTELYDSLDAAFFDALKNAQPTEEILFSPGCTSYDMFSNYEERGIYFKSLVSKIKNKVG